MTEGDAVVVGCQGGMGAPGVVGWCWIPAEDAGMTEGTGWWVAEGVKTGGV